MEAAGTALAEAVAELAPQGPIRIVCGKGNNGGDGLVAARRLAEMGFEVATLELFGRASLPTDFDAWLAGSGAVVDAIFGTGFCGRAAGAGRGGDRGDQPLRRAGRRLRHRLRGRRFERRGRGGRGRGRRSPSASTRRSSGTGSRPASGTRGAAGRPDRDSRRGARASRPAGRSTPRCSALAPRARRALDQVQLRAGGDRRRLARADRGGADVLAGGDPGRRRLRDGRGAGRPRADLRGWASPR